MDNTLLQKSYKWYGCVDKLSVADVQKKGISDADMAARIVEIVSSETTPFGILVPDNNFKISKLVSEGNADCKNSGPAWDCL